MPRRISAEEAKALGAVPVESAADSAPRRISVKEAEALGAVPVDKKTLADHLREKKARAGEIVKGTGIGIPAEEQRSLADFPGMARSAAMGFTSNMADRAESFVDAAAQDPEKQDGWVFDNSDQIHRKYMGDVEEHPLMNIGGAIAQPNPLGKMSTASKLGGAAARVGYAGANAAVTRRMGQTDSEAEQFDPTSGLLLPMALQAGAEVLSPALGKLGARYKNRAEQIWDTEAARVKDKTTATNLSAFRRKSAEGYRTIEKATADLDNPRLPRAERDAASGFLESEKGRELAAQISSNNIESGPGQLSALAATRDKLAGSAEEAAAKSADYRSKSTIVHDWYPRGKNYAARLAPAFIGDAVGATLDGAKGIGAGVAGALSGAALGKPGTSLGNLLQKTPRSSARIFETLGGVIGAGKALNQSPAAAGATANAIKDYLPKVGSPEAQQAAARRIADETGEEPEDKDDVARKFFLGAINGAL